MNEKVGVRSLAGTLALPATCGASFPSNFWQLWEPWMTPCLGPHSCQLGQREDLWGSVAGAQGQLQGYSEKKGLATTVAVVQGLPEGRGLD